MSEIDPPVCRLQFPDGSVPGNAREAAEGWKRWADEFKRRAALWERLHDAAKGANRLLESGPDLLAMCERVMKAWREVDENETVPESLNDDELWEDLESLIAKATEVSAPREESK